MGHHLMSMQCGLRALGHLALVFGLLASGALSLAVATDFWLFTAEQVILPAFTTTPCVVAATPPSFPAPPLTELSSENDDEAQEEEMATESDDLDSKSDLDADADDADSETDADTAETNDLLLPDELLSDVTGRCHGETSVEVVVVKVHSGLWRTCVYYDDPEAIEMNLHPMCENIGYFGQDNDRHDGADTTNSILRAIRKSSPVIVGSLLVMVTALALSILGNSKRDARTLLAAILYVCSALSLAVGVIFYISAVNDEVSHRKKTHTSTGESESFTYSYGWAFFFAGLSFMCAMVAAVNNISLYLRRGLEPADDDDDDDATLQRVVKDNSVIATTLTSSGRKTNLDLLQSPTQRLHPHHLHHVNITTPV